MEARHLRYAVALAEHQHFGRAAAALGIAQPPLSKQIGDLERELGARLFNRTPHGVFPTAAGDAFLSRARRALTEMSAAVVDAGRAARGETGRLRLGFIGSAVLELLPSVLSRFGREHPDVRMALHEMSSARGAAALLAGDLDIAITRGAPRGAGAENLVSVSVGQDRLIAVVGMGNPHAGQGQIHVDQLRAQTLIVAPPEEEPATLATICELLGERVLPLGGTVEARDVHTIVGLAACGIGVGLGPSCMRRAARPDVRFLDVAPHTDLPPLVMSYRAGDPGPVLGAYLDVTRELCPNVRGLR